MPDNSTNPFVFTLKINAVLREKKFKTAGVGFHIDAKILDIDHHASVYSEATLELAKQLPAGAVMMLLWIVSKLRYNTDYIEISEKRYCEEMSVSRTTFHVSRNALLNRVIAPRALRSNTFYINPAYLFRGNRSEVYPTKVSVKNNSRYSQLVGPDKADVDASGVVDIPGLDLDM